MRTYRDNRGKSSGGEDYQGILLNLSCECECIEEFVAVSESRNLGDAVPFATNLAGVVEESVGPKTKPATMRQQGVPSRLLQCQVALRRTLAGERATASYVSRQGLQRSLSSTRSVRCIFLQTLEMTDSSTTDVGPKAVTVPAQCEDGIQQRVVVLRTNAACLSAFHRGQRPLTRYRSMVSPFASRLLR